MTKTIVLDAGHGLPDTGAVGFVKEYIVAFQLMKKTETVLKRHGINVLLTRTSDNSLSTKSDVRENKNDDLGKRIAIINKADLGFSFHLNAGGGTGYESLCFNVKNDTSKQIHSDIASYFVSKGFKDRGLKSSKDSHLGGVAIIDKSKPVVVLGEFLFVDTKADTDFITAEANQNEVAEVVAKALLKVVGVVYKPFTNTK